MIKSVNFSTISFKNNNSEVFNNFAKHPIANSTLQNASQDKAQEPGDTFKKSSDKFKLATCILSLSTLGLGVLVFRNNQILKKLQGSLANKEEELNKILNAGKEEIIQVALKPFSETSLFPLFEKAKKAGKTFIGFISDSTATKAEMKEFLFGITGDEKVSKEFIKEITGNPREHQKITNILREKIGGEKNLLDWVFAKNNGYHEAYAKYISEIVKNAKTADELIKISPNWNYWLLEKNFPNGYSLGSLPNGFQNQENFRDLILKLHKNQPVPKGLKLLGYPDGGASGKMSAIIEADGKKYIVKYRQDFGMYDSDLGNKMDHWSDLRNRTNELTAIKADSTFINAQIDYYLNLHNSPNVVKFHYYDSKTQAAIYEYMEDFTHYDFDTILRTNADLSDFRSLGLIFNDLNKGNIVKLKDGSLKIIDAGEIEFADALRPGIPSNHIILPNLCSESLSNTTSAITLAKLNI